MGGAEGHQVCGAQASIALSQLTKKVAAGKEGKNAHDVGSALCVDHLAAGLAIGSPAQPWHDKVRIDPRKMFERFGLEGKVLRWLIKGRDLYDEGRVVCRDETEILLSFSAQSVPFASKAIRLLGPLRDQP